MSIRYELLKKDGTVDVLCKKAQPTSKGWLHYELSDGTIGLARPSSWRVKPVPEKSKS